MTHTNDTVDSIKIRDKFLHKYIGGDSDLINKQATTALGHQQDYYFNMGVTNN